MSTRPYHVSHRLDLHFYSTYSKHVILGINIILLPRYVLERVCQSKVYHTVQVFLRYGHVASPYKLCVLYIGYQSYLLIKSSHFVLFFFAQN